MKKVFTTLTLVIITALVFSVNKIEERPINLVEEYAGCRQLANELYDQLREDGLTHREAREARRDFVRWCRGYDEVIE